MVKLSEILKDWPEKRNREAWPSIVGAENHGYNTALTSCDREIDREALRNVLTKIIDNDPINPEEIIISTMPQWMKKVEIK